MTWVNRYVSGVARYLKEQNPDVRVVGVDTVGSIYAYYHEHGRRPLSNWLKSMRGELVELGHLSLVTVHQSWVIRPGTLDLRPWSFTLRTRVGSRTAQFFRATGR